MAITEGELDREINNQMGSPLGPEDSPLLDPGGDGLISGDGPSILKEMYRRHRDGASLKSIKRDVACSDVFEVNNRVLESCIEAGRWGVEHDEKGFVTPRSRQFKGITVRACPACGRRVLVRALRPGGCAVCLGGT